MIRVFSSANGLLVDNLRNVLEAEGIDCLVKNRDSSLAAGELPQIETWLELWVINDAEVDEAQRLLRDAARLSEVETRWRCTHCGEQSDSRFSSCWKCGTEKGKKTPPAGFSAVSSTFSPSPRLGRAVSYFAVLALGAAIAMLLDATGQNRELSPSNGSVHTMDYNEDGEQDARYVARAGIVTRFEADRNFDGEIDLIQRADQDGRIINVRSDDDFDGHFEAEYQYKYDQPNYADFDYDGDGRVDREISYKAGVVVESIFLEGDCIVTRQRFRAGRLRYADQDLDCDGEFESRTLYDDYENPVK